MSPAGAELPALTGHAYPWDVIGDPEFAPRVADLGLPEVTLAAAYHSVRAATPLHPRHQIVTAGRAAFYRPVRAAAWRGHELVPPRPDWTDRPDPFGNAAARLAAAGLGVNAWVVLTHTSYLGSVHPELAVVNCFGERYPYALCPGSAQVREYAATLAAEAVRDAPVRGITLEAWGQLGVAHGSRHDKTETAWGAAATRLLSVCCCVRCRAAWTADGVASDHVVAALRAAVLELRDVSAAKQSAELAAELVGAGITDVVLRRRTSAAAGLLGGVLDRLRAVAAGVPVSVFAGADPWSGSPLRALTDLGAEAAHTVIVGAWPIGAAAADAVRGVRRALPNAVRVAAYVTVLQPGDPGAVGPHARRLLGAGAAALNLYHLGLASSERLAAMRFLSTDIPVR